VLLERLDLTPAQFAERFGCLAIVTFITSTGFRSEPVRSGQDTCSMSDRSGTLARLLEPTATCSVTRAPGERHGQADLGGECVP
jgi:hypothetical protein